VSVAAVSPAEAFSDVMQYVTVHQGRSMVAERSRTIRIGARLVELGASRASPATVTAGLAGFTGLKCQLVFVGALVHTSSEYWALLLFSTVCVLKDSHRIACQ